MEEKNTNAENLSVFLEKEPKIKKTKGSKTIIAILIAALLIVIGTFIIIKLNENSSSNDEYNKRVEEFKLELENLFEQGDAIDENYVYYVGEYSVINKNAIKADKLLSSLKNECEYYILRDDELNYKTYVSCTDESGKNVYKDKGFDNKYIEKIIYISNPKCSKANKYIEELTKDGSKQMIEFCIVDGDKDIEVSADTFKSKEQIKNYLDKFAHDIILYNGTRIQKVADMEDFDRIFLLTGMLGKSMLSPTCFDKEYLKNKELELLNVYKNSNLDSEDLPNYSKNDKYYCYFTLGGGGFPAVEFYQYKEDGETLILEYVATEGEISGTKYDFRFVKYEYDNSYKFDGMEKVEK